MHPQKVLAKKLFYQFNLPEKIFLGQNFFWVHFLLRSYVHYHTQPAEKTRYWTIFSQILSPEQTKSVCSKQNCLTMQQLINIAFHNFLIFNVYRYQPLNTSNVLPVLNRIWAQALLCKEAEFRYSYSWYL